MTLRPPEARRVIRDEEFTDYQQSFIQNSYFEGSSNDFGYAGYYPYLYEGLSDLEDSIYQWASWQRSDECYSWNKCLKFEANDDWENTAGLMTNELTISLEDISIDRNYQTQANSGTNQINGVFYYSPFPNIQNLSAQLFGAAIPEISLTPVISKIRIMGDFDHVDEYLGNVIIGGHNFGNLGQETIPGADVYTEWYTVYDGTDQTDIIPLYSNDQRDIEYSFTPSGNIQVDGEGFNTGLYSYRISVTLSPQGSQDSYTYYSDTDIRLSQANNNEYRALNQFQKIYTANSETINQYSSLKVSFMMKTLFSTDFTNNPPYVESGIMIENPGEASNYILQEASYNSITSDDDNKKSKFGSMNRFKNEEKNVWEKMEYTFNLDDFHNIGGVNENIDNLYFLIQSSGVDDGGFRGTVLLDNFEVKESYDFIPDVDVRKKKGPEEYGVGDLTKYYDPTIPEQLEAYNDTTAPLEAQFYFYPKYFYNNPLDKEQSIIYNDFRRGFFYLYDVDWGDGSPREFTSEPKKLQEDIAIYHTYEKSGIFEIEGTILRLKPNKDLEEIGVMNNKRFTLRINVNEGLDEDFSYFGIGGFSFIPYKNTSPVIGGYSEQSIYYKSVKRQLGIISNTTIVNTEFKSDGDRLKTEIALDRMDSSHSDNFELLNAFKESRYAEASYSEGDIVDIVNNGLKTYSDELGKSISNSNITNIRYFNKPKSIVEMLGFEVYQEQSDDAELPTSPKYWKKIIPQDYSIYNRNGLVAGQYINTYSEQNWLGDYYYPVLPKYGANGKFIEGDYPNDNIPFPMEGPITDDDYSDENLKISINNEYADLNVFDDNSGNNNYGFVFNDYKPRFNKETLQPEKTKNMSRIKTSTNNGAF